MSSRNYRWFHLRFVLVSVLIASILGSFNFAGQFTSLIEYCFVDDSQSSKSTLQLFDETKAGEEERTEIDADDDFEEKSFFGHDEEPGLSLAIAGSSFELHRLTYPAGSRYGLSSLPIYLAHHSLLI